MFYNLHALFALFLVALTLATPTTQRRAIVGNITCETTMGSPWHHDVETMAVELSNEKNKKRICSQDNLFGSYCTELASTEFAKLSVCGKRGLIFCGEAAEAARELIGHCKWKGHVGGKYSFDHVPLDVRVHS